MVSGVVGDSDLPPEQDCSGLKIHRGGVLCVIRRTDDGEQDVVCAQCCKIVKLCRCAGKRKGHYAVGLLTLCFDIVRSVYTMSESMVSGYMVETISEDNSAKMISSGPKSRGDNSSCECF